MDFFHFGQEAMIGYRSQFISTRGEEEELELRLTEPEEQTSTF